MTRKPIKVPATMTSGLEYTMPAPPGSAAAVKESALEVFRNRMVREVHHFPGTYLGSPQDVAELGLPRFRVQWCELASFWCEFQPADGRYPTPVFVCRADYSLGGLYQDVEGD